MIHLACAAVLAMQAGALTQLSDEGPGLDLEYRFSDLQIERTPDGTMVRVPTSAGMQQMTPQRFVELVERAQQEQRRHGFLFVLFNITSWTGVAWVGLGLGGQLAFTARMLVQWLSSERAKRSVVPVSFWWMSLAGATMLILYFIWRKDVVGVIGQSTGWIIYIRNLWLLSRHRAPEPTVGDDPGPEPELID